MKKPDSRFIEYYQTGKYRGYYQVRGKEYKLYGRTHLTFSNGEREFFATGVFKEAALAEIFDQIDRFHSHSPNTDIAIDKLKKNSCK